MKKLIPLTLCLFIALTSYSQDIYDALRYSQNDIQGTARFRALSGAFGVDFIFRFGFPSKKILPKSKAPTENLNYISPPIPCSTQKLIS